MHPDDIATMLINSRIPPEPSHYALGQCGKCRQGAVWVNEFNRCAGCWENARWSRENRAMCNMVHRGVV
jgi:hypothetical protein